LASLVKDLDVYGSDDRIDALNHPVGHQDNFKLGSLHITALSTPCHTSGHICYFVKEEKGVASNFLT
jgi:hydroxyacylglutathione hydrolase